MTKIVLPAGSCTLNVRAPHGSSRGAAGIAAFQKALAGYKSAKGSVQFPHDEPLPLTLVAEIVRFRVAQQTARQAASGGRRPRPAAKRVQ